MAGKRRKETMEYRVYEIPQGRQIIVLRGESWKRVYGHGYPGLHFHNLLEIGICRYGEGELNMADETVIYQDGFVTVFPENIPHRTYSFGEEKNFWEYIFLDPRAILSEMFPNSPTYVTKLMQLINSRYYIFKPGEKPQLEQRIDKLIEEDAEKKVYYPRVIECEIRLMIMEMLREIGDVPEIEENPVENSGASPVTGVIDYITENLHRPIKVQELAAQCNLSETHFRRLFTEVVNMSPMDYVNLCRVQRACELMKRGNDTMEQIAQMCGFVNISTFNRNFRKFLGVSPYQWKIGPGSNSGVMPEYLILPRKGW